VRSSLACLSVAKLFGHKPSNSGRCGQLLISFIILTHFLLRDYVVRRSANVRCPEHWPAIRSRLVPARASPRSHPSSRPEPTRQAASPSPRPPVPETPCCIPRPADTLPRRQLQNLPSRNRSTSSSRLRGRRAAASSILL